MDSNVTASATQSDGDLFFEGSLREKQSVQNIGFLILMNIFSQL